jgi:PAS domain S-box-containing protein
MTSDSNHDPSVDAVEAETGAESAAGTAWDYRRVYERSAIGIFKSSPEGRYIAANPAAVRLHGYDSERELLQAVRNIGKEVYVHPEDRDNMRRMLEDSDAVIGYECELFRHKTKQRCWVRQNVWALRDDSGRLLYLEGHVEDISERKRAEQELKESRAELERRVQERTAQLAQANEALKKEIAEHLRDADELHKNQALIRALIEHSPVAISIKDLDGRYTFVSPAYTRYLGIPAEAALGKAAGDLLSPEALAALTVADHEVMSSGVALQHDQAFPVQFGAATLQVTKFPIQDEDGGTAAVGTVGIDITEQEKVQEALRLNQARLQGILDNMPVAVTVKDLEGRYLMANRHHQKLASAPFDAYQGKFPQDIFAAQLGQRIAEGDQVVLSTRKPTSTQESFALPDGERTFLTVKFPIFDEVGRLINIGSVSTDITERQRIEEQLRQAQKMEAVGQLTGGVAHDFNNLLATIMGNGEIVAGRLGENDKPAQRIIHAAQRGAELTQRLLAFSRRQPLRSKNVNLTELVGGLHQMLHRTLGETIEIEIATASSLWRALADPGQLENALLNLAINARDAMPDGGRLLIETANVTLGEGDVASHIEVTPGDYVSLSVRDTGTGMTPEVLEHAFEPFFTTKEVGDGSGLGLSMVYGFAKQSGGDVLVSSKAAGGTTVTMLLPRAQEATEAPVTEMMPPEPRGRGETLLVIEDDPEVRELTEAMLESLGYRMLSAEHARAGLAILKLEREVDLILCDVVLPGGMSGPELAQRARTIRPGTRVLFMSGYAEQSIRQRTPLPEGSDLLDKPFRKVELAQRVRAVLDR